MTSVTSAIVLFILSQPRWHDFDYLALPRVAIDVETVAVPIGSTWCPQRQQNRLKFRCSPATVTIVDSAGRP